MSLMRDLETARITSPSEIGAGGLDLRLRVGLVRWVPVVDAGLDAMLRQLHCTVRDLGHELPAAGDVRDLDVVMIAAPTVVGLDRVMMLRDLGRHVALLSYGWDRGGLAIEPVRSSGIRRFVHLSSTQGELRSALGAVIGATPSTAETVSWEHPDLARLSDRESDVLALLCRGYSNQQIAAELYLTVNTVKTYIRGAYRKMGVSRRAQAVVWGLERGVGAAYARETSSA